MPQKRQRPRLAYTPTWQGAVENWTHKFIRQNKWRCDRINGEEDLLQEAYLTFIKISEKYPNVVEPANFMSLYKRAVWNQMHDRARYLQRKRVLHAETSEDVSDLFEGRIGEVTNHGHLNLLLAEAPPELRQALLVIVNNPETLRDERRSKHRENLNMRLRRILGLDTAFDFASAIKALLSK